MLIQFLENVHIHFVLLFFGKWKVCIVERSQKEINVKQFQNKY